MTKQQREALIHLAELAIDHPDAEIIFEIADEWEAVYGMRYRYADGSSEFLTHDDPAKDGEYVGGEIWVKIAMGSVGIGSEAYNQEALITAESAIRAMQTWARTIRQKMRYENRRREGNE